MSSPTFIRPANRAFPPLAFHRAVAAMAALCTIRLRQDEPYPSIETVLAADGDKSCPPTPATASSSSITSDNDFQVDSIWDTVGPVDDASSVSSFGSEIMLPVRFNKQPTARADWAIPQHAEVQNVSRAADKDPRYPAAERESLRSFKRSGNSFLDEEAPFEDVLFGLENENFVPGALDQHFPPTHLDDIDSDKSASGGRSSSMSDNLSATSSIHSTDIKLNSFLDSYFDDETGGLQCAFEDLDIDSKGVWTEEHRSRHKSPTVADGQLLHGIALDLGRMRSTTDLPNDAHRLLSEQEQEQYQERDERGRSRARRPVPAPIRERDQSFFEGDEEDEDDAEDGIAELTWPERTTMEQQAENVEPESCGECGRAQCTTMAWLKGFMVVTEMGAHWHKRVHQLKGEWKGFDDEDERIR